MTKTRYDVTFWGRVQGVNFRWTTCRVAARFNVTGWVRNERDGSVRCVAEGEPGEVEAFVANGALEGPKAKLPFNTSGGNIGEAYIHGFELVTEAVRQVRGDSTCQVEDVNLSLVVGGPGYAPGSSVLFSKA